MSKDNELYRWVKVELANKREDFPHKNIPEINKEVFCKLNGVNFCGWLEEFKINDIAIDYHLTLKGKNHTRHQYALSNAESFEWLEELPVPDQDATPAPQGLGKEDRKYNSQYPAEITYTSDKNFDVRLKVLLDKALSAIGYKLPHEFFEQFNNAEDYLFASKSQPPQSSKELVKIISGWLITMSLDKPVGERYSFDEVVELIGKYDPSQIDFTKNENDYEREDDEIEKYAESSKELEEWVENESKKIFPFEITKDQFSSIQDANAGYRKLWKDGAIAMQLHLQGEHRGEVERLKSLIENNYKDANWSKIVGKYLAAGHPYEFGDKKYIEGFEKFKTENNLL